MPKVSKASAVVRARVYENDLQKLNELVRDHSEKTGDPPSISSTIRWLIREKHEKRKT